MKCNIVNLATNALPFPFPSLNLCVYIFFLTIPIHFTILLMRLLLHFVCKFYDFMFVVCSCSFWFVPWVFIQFFFACDCVFLKVFIQKLRPKSFSLDFPVIFFFYYFLSLFFFFLLYCMIFFRCNGSYARQRHHCRRLFSGFDDTNIGLKIHEQKHNIRKTDKHWTKNKRDENPFISW